MVYMKLNYSRILFILLVFASLSCESGKETEKTLRIREGLRNTIGIDTDSIYTSCDFIPLETTNECMLAGNPSIVYADNKIYMIRSNNNVYVYDFEGRFLREIGKYGKGHGEHGKITSCFFAPQNGIVYICSFGNEIYTYKLDGEYIKKIDIKNHEESVTRAFSLIDNTKLIGIRYVYKQAGLKCYASIYDESGNIEKDYLLYTDRLSFQLTTESFPIIYSYDGILKVKLPFENKLYEISTQEDTKYSIFDIGNLSPPRELIENCNNKHILYQEKCQILDVLETTKHLYIICFYAMRYHSIVINKSTGQVIFSNSDTHPKEIGALAYQNEDINFWPSFSEKNTIYCLIERGDTQQKKHNIQQVSGGNAEYYIMRLQER